ncbi:chromate efflux transporter [Ralstonia mannitolilytica]|uniref:chromate efflux transporter n=1 Tax=Ralstonia mannitolilytica TaxID=105219 RepID=UPI0013DD913C|nr:chromate efflux transporter [Ralstonia mannitolilytica]
MTASATPSRTHRADSAMEVLTVFLKLGLTSFGGPVAHLGYFRREFVERRRWLDDEAFTDLVGLCQFLPGPASSQAGFSIGLLRAGWLGGLAAWFGFTLPSVLLLLAFAMVAPKLNGMLGNGLVHGLKLVAVAVVAQAVWDMARRLCPDRRRAAIALITLALLALLTTVYAQLIVIAVGALLGCALCRPSQPVPAAQGGAGQRYAFHVAHAASIGSLMLFFALLFGLPALTQAYPLLPAEVFGAFYRSGALVFGGGHVVLPLLEQQTVATGWVTSADFLAGYGAAQAVPGPLFTFAAFLGWTIGPGLNHWVGAALATAGIFLPGLLLVVAALPYWQALRARPSMAALLAGVNAAVVGLLAMALYSPVWVSAVRSGRDFAIAAVALLLLTRWKAPPLLVVGLCAAAGIAQAAFG